MECKKEVVFAEGVRLCFSVVDELCFAHLVVAVFACCLEGLFHCFDELVVVLLFDFRQLFVVQVESVSQSDCLDVVAVDFGGVKLSRLSSTVDVLFRCRVRGRVGVSVGD